MFNRSKAPYSQAEVSEQIGIIAELMAQRDKTQFSKRQAEYKRTNDAIAAAQEVLNYMLEEIQEYNSRHATNRRSKRHSKVTASAHDTRPSVVGELAEKPLRGKK